ncbi:DUF192 domain-containing protein [Dendrosporobacter sp. 1207_IL3150]|uniref:DUF192 domain-containing protein n=1 Tax=Dendrosporobacter sp. 1207_IL3150 TaxID=3084054 RepID=UPI002FD96F53
MKLINETNGYILADQVRIADNFFARLKGLLGTALLPPGHCLVIRPCNSVHTFGMRYPIDVLFVSKDDVVLEKVSKMQSGKIAAKKGSSYVIELPAGGAEPANAGDKLVFKR